MLFCFCLSDVWYKALLITLGLIYAQNIIAHAIYSHDIHVFFFFNLNAMNDRMSF